MEKPTGITTKLFIGAIEGSRGPRDNIRHVGLLCVEGLVGSRFVYSSGSGCVEVWKKMRFDESEQIPLTLNDEQGEVGK